jgi:hypothetical protein
MNDIKRATKIISHISNMYLSDYEDNVKSTNKNIEYYHNILSQISESNISEENKKRINIIIIKILEEKVFGETQIIIDKFTSNKQTQLFKYKRNSNDQAMVDYFVNMSKFIQMFKTNDQINDEFCKRIDIYGFGTILMDYIFRYIKSNKKNNINLIMDIFEIINYCCVIDYDIKYISFDIIEQKIQKIIKKEKQIKGGIYYSKGTFGKVYGIPRLPCKNETNVDDSFNNEISKVYFNPEQAREELNIIRRLKQYLNDNEIDILRKYFVLPIKMCKLNNNLIKSEPYSNKNYYESITGFETDMKRLKNMDTQITFPRGDMDLYDYFKLQIDNPIDTLIKLLNILRGLKYLHGKGFMHGDLKSNNCISIENTYKIIDLDTMFYYKQNNAYKKYMFDRISSSFNYIVYPSSIVATLNIKKI